MKIFKTISAEFIKLKYAPIFSLICFTVFVVCAIVFFATYMGVNDSVRMGRNPWPRNLNASLAIYSIFILIPFAVMFISTAVFVENQARGWKFIYATPNVRASIFFSKLFSLLVGIFMLAVIMIILTTITTYFVDFLLPEYEFRFYTPDIKSNFLGFVHAFISILGVIGIQYFISLRFKGFLIPMSFGVLMFIVGFIVATTDKPYALYSPYSYPGIVKDHNMYTIGKIGVTHEYWLSNVEMFSIAIFLFFVIAALILEVRKDVTN